MDHVEIGDFEEIWEFDRNRDTLALVFSVSVCIFSVSSIYIFFIFVILQEDLVLHLFVNLSGPEFLQPVVYI